MAGGGSSESGEPEFQVAPMVDVLLTILVFFMTITSAQVLKVDKTVQLPIAKNAQRKDNSRAEAILNVRWKLPEKKAFFVLNDKSYRVASEMVLPLKLARITGEKKVAAGANDDVKFKAMAAIERARISLAKEVQVLMKEITALQTLEKQVAKAVKKK